MFDVNDVMVIEGGDASEEEYFTSMQRAINSGHAWSMQGSMGRAMMDAIKSGKCLLGKSPAQDFWKNHIPSRSEVKEGTKGSRQFVVEHSGEEWAVMMEAVD